MSAKRAIQSLQQLSEQAKNDDLRDLSAALADLGDGLAKKIDQLQRTLDQVLQVTRQIR